jgi:hypothetical protein
LVVEVAFNTHLRETMPEVRWGMGGGNTTFNTLFVGIAAAVWADVLPALSFNTLFVGNAGHRDGSMWGRDATFQHPFRGKLA